MKLQQISFTRVNGVGWCVVNASEDLTENVVRDFSKIQNGNTKSPDFDPEDIDNRITIELSVGEESDSVFFTRIKSNSGVDEAGRSIMFSNSFVGSLDDFVHDPLAILNIDGSNYRFTIEETKSLPEKIKMRSS